jgi:formylglycine-generating enzyme required for sulfatase activity
MKLVLIPKGKFKMGSPDGEPGRDGDEGPVHDVELTKPFYMAAHTVTIGQFKEFVKATGYKTEAESEGTGGNGFNVALKKFDSNMPKYNWQETGWPQTDRHPVVNVTWNDAMKFCDWLSKKERKAYRLPTEAEWEYACRAGTSTRFWSGDADESLKGAANVADQSFQDKQVGGAGMAFAPWNDMHPFTAPVGNFRPNPWGLYDMHGNLWQWCEDWYAPYAERDLIDHIATEKGAKDARVLRGGSWYNNPNRCRAANRNRNAPANRNENYGCRVVLCLHFRACLTGRPRIDPLTDAPGVVPEVLTCSWVGYFFRPTGTSRSRVKRRSSGCARLHMSER